jgi:beta-glucosidase
MRRIASGVIAGWPARFAVGLGTLALFQVASMLLPTTSATAESGPSVSSLFASVQTDCPWVQASQDGKSTPAALAAEVESQMTLAQKVAFVIMVAQDGYENVTAGIPSLCIPPLILTDGPNGVAYRVHGVTQLPASIGLASSFDPAVTRQAGVVSGQEGKTKGFDVVQGPEVNLARVPQSGRIFEAYGEDPDLAGVMGTADVEGIQSQGTIANIKHLTAYNQETYRVQLNQDVPLRSLVELYDAPFIPLIEQGHADSVMCSYGSLNGVNTCSDPVIYDLLKSWGFTGFVRSDLMAVVQPGQAFAAGIDLLKPATATSLTQLVGTGALTPADLDTAVEQVLTPMFAFGLIAHPRQPNIHADAITPAHTAIALSSAERSVVLLKNDDNVLPLASKTSSVAVIGSDAGAEATTRGVGSSQVLAPFISTPIKALRVALGKQATVTYTPADAPNLKLPLIKASDLSNGLPLQTEFPSQTPEGQDARTEPGKRDVHIDLAPNTTPAAGTAVQPGTGPGWSFWGSVLEVHRTGTYDISAETDGDTWLYVDGKPIISSPGLHGRSRWATTIHLVAGRKYNLAMNWFAVDGEPVPQLGLADVTPEINAAVAAAKHASTALVFVSAIDSEGVDQPNLSLPGDANALISAVAAVNPHTVVVLNTGGPVVMPWENEVAGIVEAWYPGEEDGAATAAVLTGAVDPSGHLPLTFPTPTNPSPVGTQAQYPGIDSTVHYTEGLDIGYRWYQAHDVTPAFPFGFGLSYTSFGLTKPSVRTEGDHVVADVTVTNTGHRAGRTVVQAYLHYPAAAGEPPDQLRAFQSVDLKPSQSRTIQLSLPRSAFEAFLNGKSQTVPGLYQINIGQSSADLPIHLPTNAPT